MSETQNTERAMTEHKMKKNELESEARKTAQKLERAVGAGAWHWAALHAERLVALADKIESMTEKAKEGKK